MSFERLLVKRRRVESGKWEELGKSGGRSYPVEATIGRDGSFQMVSDLSGPPGQIVGTIRISGGEVFYDDTVSSGTISLHESEARRVLR